MLFKVPIHYYLRSVNNSRKSKLADDYLDDEWAVVGI